MNLFQQPSSGADRWTLTYDFDAHYRRLAAEEVELGRRVCNYLYGHGENAYGWGYEYARHAAVLHRLRRAGEPQPQPRDRQLALFGAPT